MSLMIKDIQLLKSYNKIWKKIEKFMKIDTKLLMVMMINMYKQKSKHIETI